MPTEDVFESDLDVSNSVFEPIVTVPEQPIELKFKKIPKQDLYVKIYGFKSFNQASNMINELQVEYKTTTEKDGENYSILLGPVENIYANKLVSSFISKGYKKTEIILE